MPNLFGVTSTIVLIIVFLLLAVKIFAFVTALMFRDEAFRAAGKLNKPIWAVILGLAVLVQLVTTTFGIFNLVFTIAAFVYLADVRPALTGLRRR